MIKQMASGLTLISFEQITLQTKLHYLIDKLIPLTGLVVVWGPPKSCKSFVVFDAVMHVALGWNYRGHKVHQGPVVYCAMEGIAGYGARSEAFRQRHLANRADSIPFYLVGSPMTLVSDAPMLVKEIKATIGPDNPAVIVLDTLNRSIGGSESDDRDMAAYIRAVDALSATLNCAVIVVHHCGVDKSRPRGHTSLTGAADAQLSVKRTASTGDIVVTVEWMKDGAEGEVIHSSLDEVVVGTDQDGNPITSCVVVPNSGSGPTQSTINRKLSPRQQAALDALDKVALASGQPAPAGFGLPPSTVTVKLYDWKTEMLTTGVIDPKSKNPRADFQRIRKSLRAHGQIDERSSLVWRV